MGSTVSGIQKRESPSTVKSGCERKDQGWRDSSSVGYCSGSRVCDKRIAQGGRKCPHPRTESFRQNSNARLEDTTCTGETALHIAAPYDRAEMVQELIERDARIEMANRDGQTAIHIACRMAFSKIVALLQRNHAKTKANDGIGRTPLQVVRRERAESTDIQAVVRMLSEGSG
jgi:hypothetical protein